MPNVCSLRLTVPPAPRCSPRPRVSPSGLPGRCPGLGSCSSAGAATTAPRLLLRCWPTDCACPGPRAPVARWGVGRSTEKLGLCWSPYRKGRGL